MIPREAHFIWIGDTLPYTHVLALRSAARRGGFERVLLHHTHDLSGTPHFERLLREPGVRLERLEAAAFVERAAVSFPGVAERFARLEQPAAIANVLRLLLLWQRGGVYLDLDTITLGSLEPLLARAGFFCGQERLVFPASLLSSWHPWPRLKALGLTALRDGLRRLPSGPGAYRRFERAFPIAANNAVLGAEPEHPFLRHLLGRMGELPDARWGKRFALGTHLLQAGLAEFERQAESAAFAAGPPARGPLEVLAPEAFYPLGPEISEHWFRRHASLALEEFLSEATLVVHWYASVRTARHTRDLGPVRVREQASTQAFSALARAFVDDED